MKKGSAGSLQTIDMAKSLPPQVPLSVALAPFPRIFRRRSLLRTRAISKDFLTAVAMGLVLLFVLPAGASSTPGAAGVPASIPHAVHGAEGGASPPSGLRAGVAGGPETAMEVTVPGHYSTFKEAIDKFDSGQDTSTILVQQGEHRWDNFLEIGHTVNVRGGSNNALLPGTLWMKKGSAGSLQTIEMAKDSGSCIIFEGGAWSQVLIKNSFLGGLDEGPGYCINCQDHTRTTVQSCHLEGSCGEFSAALAVFHNVCVRVQQCTLQSNQMALRAVTAKDATLEFVSNQITGSVWYDASRPGTLVMEGNTADGMAISDTNAETMLPNDQDIPI